MTAETPDKKHSIAGLLLAAGRSSRMGGIDKLLCEIDNVSLLRRSAEAMLESKVDKVLVAIPAGAKAHFDEIADLPIEIIEVQENTQGMSASIRTGMEEISKTHTAVIIGLADMPEIKGKHYNQILKSYQSEVNRSIICPVTKTGARGNPVLFDLRFFDELQNIKGDTGARVIIDRHHDFVRTVKMNDNATVCDLDTPEAWLQWMKGRGERRGRDIK